MVHTKRLMSWACQQDWLVCPWIFNELDSIQLVLQKRKHTLPSQSPWTSMLCVCACTCVFHHNWKDKHFLVPNEVGEKWQCVEVRTSKNMVLQGLDARAVPKSPGTAAEDHSTPPQHSVWLFTQWLAYGHQSNKSKACDCLHSSFPYHLTSKQLIKQLSPAFKTRQKLPSCSSLFVLNKAGCCLNEVWGFTW